MPLAGITAQSPRELSVVLVSLLQAQIPNHQEGLSQTLASVARPSRWERIWPSVVLGPPHGLFPLPSGNGTENSGQGGDFDG